MRLSEKDSLKWLKRHGHNIKQATYHKVKKKIRDSTDKRKFELSREGLWKHDIEKNPEKCMRKIIKKIQSRSHFRLQS